MFQLGKDETNAFQMFLMLNLEGGQQFLTKVLQTLYISTDCLSCCPSASRLAAAFSNWRVLPAAWFVVTLIFFSARATWSKPICCWLVAATICWKACTLDSMLSAM